ncbi:MAG: KpsF/GutQ family sugar-phosphate isomerase [Planctomycetota bacterium]|nr:MAG: KpsF/GutQ family sugar-phosphate isomerase [Planctomycetota bacterium]
MTQPGSAAESFGPFRQLRHAREILAYESRVVAELAQRLDGSFTEAIALLARCRGRVVVSGMGKAGLIGQKISATLASTGTPSYFLHPGEAFHGDLGRLAEGDVALILSRSGETEEVVRLLPSLASMHVPVIAMTARPNSALAKAAAVVLDIGDFPEAGELRLAPTASTTAMLALGDALALVLSRLRRFAPHDFARFHPGGSLGRKLSKVEDHMRPLTDCRVASDRLTVREVIVATAKPGRRTGAVMLVDDEGRLTGLFTDSDLAKLVEKRSGDALDLPIASLMTKNPITVCEGTAMSEAVQLLADRKISELPVTDDRGCPVGLIDVTDVVALFPDQLASHRSAEEASGERPGPWRLVRPVDESDEGEDA